MRVAGWLLCTAVVGAAQCPGEPTRPEKHSAVGVRPRSADELAATLALGDDLWSERVDEEPVVVVLSPEGLRRLEARGVPHEILVDDVDAVAERERERLGQRTKGAVAGWFDEYRDVDEVNDYLDALAERHPAWARVRRIGASVEGQPIRAIEISGGGELGIVLDGGHHAREWISVMVPICIADRLSSRADTDPRVREILRSVRFFVVPILNPDGYRYTWDVDRYWRKSRRGGYGVDLNRNYGVGWGGAGSSPDRSSQNFRGEHAFSEPETRAMRDLFASERIVAHVDFHSFSQVIVWPWSHRRTPPPDEEKFAAIADRMSTAIYAEHGETYRIRPGSELGVGAGGTAGDWTYGEHGALSFTVELRPSRGPNGFVLPPEQIVPTCDEGLAAVLALAEQTIRDAAVRERDVRAPTDERR